MDNVHPLFGWVNKTGLIDINYLWTRHFFFDRPWTKPIGYFCSVEFCGLWLNRYGKLILPKQIMINRWLTCLLYTLVYSIAFWAPPFFVSSHLFFFSFLFSIFLICSVIWLLTQPVLAVMYLVQYMPSIGYWLMDKVIIYSPYLMRWLKHFLRTLRVIIVQDGTICYVELFCNWRAIGKREFDLGRFRAWICLKKVYVSEHG